MAPTMYTSPSLASFPPSERTAAPDTAPVPLDKPIPTPPSVRDLTPSVCLSLVEFKDLLRQFRALDDSITLRLNRSVSRSRDLGTSAPPTLLQQHTKEFSSSAATDLGKSTYAVASETVCAAFWRELANVWMLREDAIHYCAAVNAQHRPAPPPPRGDVDRLDLDAPARTPSRSAAQERAQAEFVTRQLHNELAVESIIRRRSLDAFKSRCRAFQPDFGRCSAREQALWEGS
ncbi:hypothetical protein MSPP1_003486 [Malassezia sp. CBS 17886]|nr:hypothetical protein MSPP1_003486 [Malassezia sp. CBS 17886]